MLQWDESPANPLPAPPVLRRGFTLPEPPRADNDAPVAWLERLQPALQAGATQLAHDLRAVVRPARRTAVRGWALARAAVGELQALLQDATREGAANLNEDTRALNVALRELAAGAASASSRAAGLMAALPRWYALLRETARIGGAELLEEARPIIEMVRRRVETTPLPALWQRLATASRALAQRWHAAAGEAWARSAPHRAAAKAAWLTARASVTARWRTGLAALRRDERRLLRSLVAADAALAVAIALVLILGGPALFASSSVSAAHPVWQARAALAVAQAAGLRSQAPASAAPTLVPPTATPAPTATPEPVLTATPIPVVFTTWESSLPTQGGWNGLAECWGTVLAPVGSGAFSWPTDKRFLVGKNYNVWSHPGLDLGGDVGDPLYAADGGVVVYAGWNVYGFGNLVILDHGNGWHTLYAHMSQINVTCGQGVTQGSILGLAGSTGRSTGPHLHFEMRYYGGNVNPWAYLP